MKKDIESCGTLENYLHQIELGHIQVEPLVIRANVNDCIEIQLTNSLPQTLENSAFQLKTLTDIVGFHIHLVKFDTIVSDGAANGWNNIAGARQYETLIERFYANEQLHTVFFHDHLFANSHQQHGMFGALIIEPKNSYYLNPKNGCPLTHGTKAIICQPGGKKYREFVLFVHDFALLFDKNNKPINSPEVPGSHDDPGVMGINYRCEPMKERLKIKDDHAHIFSSFVHGDPATPLLETYPNEEMIIRLVDGAHEEQHSFNITGLAWKKEITNINSPLVQQQTIGISEAFNIYINQKYQAGDYLYYFSGIDDLWLGLWSIIRVHSVLQKDLIPLYKPISCQSQHYLEPPIGANIRHFEIAAIQKEIEYNAYGDHDPDGLIFISYADRHKVKKKSYHPKPLILRARAGEWIEITLHNLIDPHRPIKQDFYPSVPVEYKHTP